MTYSYIPFGSKIAMKYLMTKCIW